MSGIEHATGRLAGDPIAASIGSMSEGPEAGTGRFRFIGPNPHDVRLHQSAVLLSLLLGLLFAELVNSRFWGRGLVRTMLITPFLVMPVVAALGWKNMMLHPDSRKELGKAGRKRASRTFDLREHAAQLARIYDELVQG